MTGTYEFKFLIDDMFWRVDPVLPSCSSADGMLNNLVGSVASRKSARARFRPDRSKEHYRTMMEESYMHNPFVQWLRLHRGAAV